jgi:hypothetical protein
MNNLAEVTTIGEHTSTWREAILIGPYLRRKRCRVLISPNSKILDSSILHNRWSGTEQYDAPFRQAYHPHVLPERAG